MDAAECGGQNHCTRVEKRNSSHTTTSLMYYRYHGVSPQTWLEQFKDWAQLSITAYLPETGPVRLSYAFLAILHIRGTELRRNLFRKAM